MNLYEATVPQLTKMLKNLDLWLTKAEAHAKAKAFDVNTLLTARLAPDQYPLVKQIQGTCDAAKFTAFRLSGKEAPAHPDTEQTIEELHARIGKCVDYLNTLTPGDFETAGTRWVTLPFMPGKKIIGQNYAVEIALPNFYFHLTTAYAILRHNGVDVGKTDYIGSVSVLDA